MTIYLPDVDWPSAPTPSPATPRRRLNARAQKPAKIQATTAAQNAALRLLYGRVRVGAQIANLVAYGNRLVLQAVWGDGPCSTLEALHLNDEALPSGTTVVSYGFDSVSVGSLGTPSAIDPTLASAFAARGHTYTDTLPGIAYSVISLPASAGFPQITATIKGLKVGPLAEKSFSDLITFTRADATTCATYFDSTGVMRTAAANIPRIDYGWLTSERNLLSFSEAFDSVDWTISGTSVVTANTAVAPDGTTTADTLTDDNAAAWEYIYRTSGLSATQNTVYCASVYVKKDAVGRATRYSILRLHFTDSGTSIVDVQFDTSTGEFNTPNPSGTGVRSGAGVIDSGDYWRVWLAGSDSSASTSLVNFQIYPVAGASSSWVNSSSATGSLTVWGAQLEIGSVPTDYEATDASRATRTWGALGLLVEESRTNYVRNSYPTVGGGVISTGTATAPDGTTAKKFVVNAGATSFPSVGSPTIDSFAIALTAGQTQDFTVTGYFSNYGAQDLRPYIVVAAHQSGASYAYALFLLNAATGAVSNKAVNSVYTELSGPTVTLMPCGMYRFVWSLRYTQDATTRNTICFNVQVRDSAASGTYTADGASGIQLACLQLEKGAFPTSYITTTSAAVTRAADVATMTGTNFSSWYNQTEGTFVARADSARPAESADSAFIYSSRQGASDYIACRTSSGYSPDRLFNAVVVGGAAQMSGEGTAATGYLAMPRSVVVSAAAYKQNDFANSFDGNACYTDASGTLPTPTALYIGTADGTTAFLNGHVARLTYYPTRLADADLVTLSGGGTVPDAPTLHLDFAQQRYYLTGTAWTDNPALVLGDAMASTTHGAGWTLDHAALIENADACGALLSGVARRKIGLVIDSPQPVPQWLEVLRTYAACWIDHCDGYARQVPDRPRDTDLSIAHASGQIRKIGDLRRRGVAQAPTVIEVSYTDTSTTPWREASVWAYADGVLGGSTPRRDSRVSLPGIQSAAQAQREANERLNKLWLSDLSFDLEMFDEAAQVQLGDVVEVTHPIGLTAKAMRVVGLDGNYGRYRLQLAEYDPAVYSDVVVGEPSYPDTSLPDPSDPPTPTGLTASEELVQLLDGTWGSRIRLSWTAAEVPYLVRYAVTITQAGNTVDARTLEGVSYASPPVKEAVPYACTVATVSSIGATSASSSVNITPIGKYLPPNPVPINTLTAFEAGGTVYLSWGQATDIDVWRYQIKRGTTGQSFAEATQIDLVDALRYQDNTTAAGTWRFWVEVVDSVRNVSGTPRSVDVTVTSDSNSFLIDSYNQTAPGWQNMLTYSEQFDNAAWAKTASSISANATTAPDGTTTADKVSGDTTTGFHDLAQTVTGSIGVAYAISLYCKAAEHTRYRLAGKTSANWSVLPAGVFDLVSGSVVSSTGDQTATIRAIGDGWYLCTVYGTCATATSIGLAGGPVPTGLTSNSYNGTTYPGGVYVWGAQFTAHANAQPYQATTSAAITEGGQNMARYTLGPTDTNTYYVTEDNVSFASKYSSNLSTYANALATYHNSVTSTWLGESEDFGLSLSGQWTGTATVSALSGSLTSYMGLSADGSSWTYYSGLSQKKTGRFARMKHEATTTSTLMVTVPTQNIRLDAVPREEVGTGTSSAAGATTITLTNDYTAVKKITITPEGTTARSATYDNIVLGDPTTFDVYVFNDAGTKIASTFRYQFQGV